jgi:RNA polymerase sigma factor for flagellar operon FliA
MGIEAYKKVSKTVGDSARSFETYMPLVERIAYHLKGRLPASVQIEDLVQSGTIGLLEAIQAYDATQGASFETYAGIRIKGAMMDELRRGDWTPRSVHRKSREVSAAVARVEAKLGREAHDAEIAKELNISLTEYHSILQDVSGAYLLAIDEPDENGLDEDQLGAADEEDPFSLLTKSEFAGDLAQVIESLPEKEKLVMSLYYDQELNLKEIGLVLEVSESRVSQIHSQAIARIRSRLKGWM